MNPAVVTNSNHRSGFVEYLRIYQLLHHQIDKCWNLFHQECSPDSLRDFFKSTKPSFRFRSQENQGKVRKNRSGTESAVKELHIWPVEQQNSTKIFRYHEQLTTRGHVGEIQFQFLVYLFSWTLCARQAIKRSILVKCGDYSLLFYNTADWLSSDLSSAPELLCS